MDLTNLVAKFKRIGENHETAIRERTARLVPGGAVIRVFMKKTREALIRELCNIPVAERFYRVQNDILGKAADQAHVPRVWFDDVWSAQEG